MRPMRDTRVWTVEAAPADATTRIATLSPAAMDAELTKSVQVVFASEMVQLTDVSAVLLRSRTVKLWPAPGAVETFTRILESVEAIE